MKKQILLSGLVLMAGLSSTFAASSVPRACIEHAIMTSFDNPNMMASCPVTDGEPVRGGKKRTSAKLIDEITSDYNTIAECFGLNAGFYFSKITGESGFQVNTLGPAGDGGIGQLTKIAIDTVNEYLPGYLYRIRHSGRKACQTLTKLLKTKLKDQVQASSEYENRCALINDQENPLRNLLYTMVLNDINRRSINSAYNNRDIDSKMIQAGVFMNAKDLDRLKSLLAMMGYNMGAANAVQDLSNYLDARIEFIERKAKEYPNPLLRPQLIAYFNPGVHSFLKMVNADDLNIVEGLERYKSLRKPYLEELTAKLGDETKAKQAYGVWLRNISASELSFSEWLWVWQKSRGIAYVNMINNVKDRMDREMGPGVCTSDHMSRN